MVNNTIMCKATGPNGSTYTTCNEHVCKLTGLVGTFLASRHSSQGGGTPTSSLVLSVLLQPMSSHSSDKEEAWHMSTNVKEQSPPQVKSLVLQGRSPQQASPVFTKSIICEEGRAQHKPDKVNKSLLRVNLYDSLVWSKRSSHRDNQVKKEARRQAHQC